MFESVTPVNVDRGVVLLGVVSEGYVNHSVGLDAWPPPRFVAIRGARLAPGEEWSLAVGLRAREPGRNGYRGLRVRYRMGARKFEELVDDRVTLVVRR